jgi:hypothetical protein
MTAARRTLLFDLENSGGMASWWHRLQSLIALTKDVLKAESQTEVCATSYAIASHHLRREDAWHFALCGRVTRPGTFY